MFNFIIAFIMNILDAEHRGIKLENIFSLVASEGELTQTPQPPSPSPSGEGVKGMR